MSLPPPPFLTLAPDLRLTALAPGEGQHLTGLPHAGDEVVFAGRDATGRLLGVGGVLAIDWVRRAAHLAWIVTDRAAGPAAAGPALVGLARYALDELGLERLEADEAAPGAAHLATLSFARAEGRWRLERPLLE